MTNDYPVWGVTHLQANPHMNEINSSIDDLIKEAYRAAAKKKFGAAEPSNYTAIAQQRAIENILCPDEGVCDQSPPPPEAIAALYECIELQKKKGNDYQNKTSSVEQADYFRRGMDTLVDMLNIKLLRITSVVETARANPDATPNNESLEDSLKDLINYASFAVAYSRGKLPGQNPDNDMFNQPRGTV